MFGHFSKSVGHTDPKTAEIIALREACDIFKRSSWGNHYRLIFESDSKLLVDWIQNAHLCLTIFKPLIHSCLDLCKVFDWRISFVNREANVLADNLEKKKGLNG
ncbi:hypothetical protein GQ457_09G017000 [Hibiscus cannabinus]